MISPKRTRFAGKLLLFALIAAVYILANAVYVGDISTRGDTGINVTVYKQIQVDPSDNPLFETVDGYIVIFIGSKYEWRSNLAFAMEYHRFVILLVLFVVIIWSFYTIVGQKGLWKFYALFAVIYWLHLMGNLHISYY